MLNSFFCACFVKMHQISGQNNSREAPDCQDADPVSCDELVFFHSKLFCILPPF